MKILVKPKHPALISAMFSPEPVWLPCAVECGLFSNESAVEITISGKTVSLFADHSLIGRLNNQDFILVTSMGNNGKPKHKSILLPSEAFETSSRFLSVPEEMLRPVSDILTMA